MTPTDHAQAGAPERMGDSPKQLVANAWEALRSERDDALWNAFHCGSSRDGKWTPTPGLSDCEWLCREIGIDPLGRDYDEDVINAKLTGAAERYADGLMNPVADIVTTLRADLANALAANQQLVCRDAEAREAMQRARDYIAKGMLDRSGPVVRQMDAWLAVLAAIDGETK